MGEVSDEILHYYGEFPDSQPPDKFMNEPETAVALRPQQSMAVGPALGVDEILAQVTLIQNVMHRVMKDGEHYGTIPGCGDKKTLLQPGAQKLTMTFRLAPEYQLQETDLPRGHKEYRVICTLKSIATGTFVGQGVGCCSTMESKYRWRGGSRKCPKCGKETIIKGKQEYGGGWLCYAKKGGCGAKWGDGAAAKEIESQSVEKVENENPADHFNTVLKMAKKRAFVDATITATAASDIFTQDTGDAEAEDEPVKAPEPKHKPLLERIGLMELWAKKELGPDAEWLVPYLRAHTPDGGDKTAALMPGEMLDALSEASLAMIKTDPKGFLERVKKFAQENDQVPGAEVKPRPAGPMMEKPVTELWHSAYVNEVTSKSGETNGKPWTLFGIKVGTEWFNTFSKTLAEAATKLQDQYVRVSYETTPKGKNAIAIDDGKEIIRAGQD